MRICPIILSFCLLLGTTSTALGQSDEDPMDSESEHDLELPDLSAPASSSWNDPYAKEDGSDTEEEAPAESPNLVPLTTRVFVDSFYMVDWNDPEQNDAAGALPHRAYDFTEGFVLAFAGIDVDYQQKEVGLTLDLRFGKGASRYLGQLDPVLATVKQAYGTWKPIPSLKVDLGQFDTIYGGEVTDSWPNLNYSRGALYYLQPFYHTGLRATYNYETYTWVRIMAVNGTNALPIDNNQTPHVGAQIGLNPISKVNVALGYYSGAQSSGYGKNRNPGNQDQEEWLRSDSGWEHMGDLVVTYRVDPITVIANGTYLRNGQLSEDCLNLDNQTVCGPSDFWGASLAVGYSVSPVLGVALRGEYLVDDNQYVSNAYDELKTATATIDYRPVSNVILRLEHRVEIANEEVYATNDHMDEMWQATTLSMVVATDTE